MATVEEFSERWKEQVLSQRKPSTICTATTHLRHHILPQLGHLKLDQLGREAQQVFVTRLSQTRSRKIVLNILGTLSSMLKTAKQWGYICVPVDSAAPVLPRATIRTPPRLFSAEEARQIIVAAQEPYATAFSVAAMTGIRAGELLGLQVGDLDFERKQFSFGGPCGAGEIQTPKNPASFGVLPVPVPLEATLKKHMETWRPNPLRLVFANRFGRPMDSERIVRKVLRPILDELKIPRAGLHAFRHTHTSLLLDLGAPPTVAQAQLRHADPRITLGIYGHVVGDAHRLAVEKVAEALCPAPRQLRPNAPRPENHGE